MWTMKQPYTLLDAYHLKYDVMSHSAGLVLGIFSSLLSLFNSFPMLPDITIASSISETTVLTEHD